MIPCYERSYLIEKIWVQFVPLESGEWAQEACFYCALIQNTCISTCFLNHAQMDKD